MSRRWLVVGVAAFLLLGTGLAGSLLGSNSGALLAPEQTALLRGGAATGATGGNCIDLDEKECTTWWPCHDRGENDCEGANCFSSCSATGVLEYRATEGQTYLEKSTYNPGECGFLLNGASCQAYNDPNMPDVHCWCQGGVLPPPNQRVPCGQLNDTDFSPCE